MSGRHRDIIARLLTAFRDESHRAILSCSETLARLETCAELSLSRFERQTVKTISSDNHDQVRISWIGYASRPEIRLPQNGAGGPGWRNRRNGMTWAACLSRSRTWGLPRTESSQKAAQCEANVRRKTKVGGIGACDERYR